MDIAREVVSKITQVMNHYSETEMQVREATNDDPWGPTGHMLHKLAMYTHNSKGSYVDTMYMLYKRMLHESRTNHRRIHKSLVILSYLLKHGSRKVVTSASDRLYDIKHLADLHIVDEFGRDQTTNIKMRVREVVNLLEKPELMEQERIKAQQNLKKITGFSRELSQNYADDSWSDDPKLPSDRPYNESHEANWGSNEYKDDVVGVGGVCFVEHEKGDGARVDYTKCKLEYSFQYHDDDEYYNDGNYLDKGRSRTYSDDVDDENGNKTPSKSYKDYNNNEFHDVAEEEEEEDEEKKKNLSVSADRSGEDNGIEDDSFNPRKYDKTREKEVGMKSNGRMQESGVIHSSEVPTEGINTQNNVQSVPDDFGDFANFEENTTSAEDLFDPLSSAAKPLANLHITTLPQQQQKIFQQQPILLQQQPVLLQQQPVLLQQQPVILQQQTVILQQQPVLQQQQQPVISQQQQQQQQQRVPYSRNYSQPTSHPSFSPSPIFYSPPACVPQFQLSQGTNTFNQQHLQQQQQQHLQQHQQQQQLNLQQTNYSNFIGLNPATNQPINKNQTSSYDFNENNNSLI